MKVQCLNPAAVLQQRSVSIWWTRSEEAAAEAKKGASCTVLQNPSLDPCQTVREA